MKLTDILVPGFLYGVNEGLGYSWTAHHGYGVAPSAYHYITMQWSAAVSGRQIIGFSNDITNTDVASASGACAVHGKATGYGTGATYGGDFEAAHNLSKAVYGIRGRILAGSIGWGGYFEGRGDAATTEGYGVQAKAIGSSSEIMHGVHGSASAGTTITSGVTGNPSIYVENAQAEAFSVWKGTLLDDTDASLLPVFAVDNDGGIVIQLQDGTDKFTVAGATGNTLIAGDLGVTGTITGINVDSGADPGHTHTSGSIPANVVYDARLLTAGAGLTGGGDLSADRTFDVGAGNGISVAADAVAVNEAYAFAFTGAHTHTANSTWSVGTGKIGIGSAPLAPLTLSGMQGANNVFGQFRTTNTTSASGANLYTWYGNLTNTYSAGAGPVMFAAFLTVTSSQTGNSVKGIDATMTASSSTGYVLGGNFAMQSADGGVTFGYAMRMGRGVSPPNVAPTANSLTGLHLQYSSSTTNGELIGIEMYSTGTIPTIRYIIKNGIGDIDLAADATYDTAASAKRWKAGYYQTGFFGDHAGGNYSDFDADGDLSQTGTARREWGKYTANSITAAVGTLTGAVGTLQTAHDGSFLQLAEAAATPAANLIVDFVSVTAFNWVQIISIYDGGATHSMAVQLYNWTQTRWDTFNSMQTGQEDVSTADGYILEDHSFTVPTDTEYIGTGGDAGKVRVRFFHTMGGSVNHDSYYDVVALYQ